MRAMNATNRAYDQLRPLRTSYAISTEQLKLIASNGHHIDKQLCRVKY